MDETLPFAPGARLEMGSHRFTAGEIIEFATKYDPQRIHVDAEAAGNSVFGGLCASGWHTASIWMKLNVATVAREIGKARAEGRRVPEFGPSPGFRNLKWFKPVFAGDEIRYAQIVRGTRALAKRPGWSILETQAEAHNQAGDLVMSFESAVMVRMPDDTDAGQP